MNQENETRCCWEPLLDLCPTWAPGPGESVSQDGAQMCRYRLGASSTRVQKLITSRPRSVLLDFYRSYRFHETSYISLKVEVTVYSLSPPELWFLWFISFLHQLGCDLNRTIFPFLNSWSLASRNNEKNVSLETQLKNQNLKRHQFSEKCNVIF